MPSDWGWNAGVMAERMDEEVEAEEEVARPRLPGDDDDGGEGERENRGRMVSLLCLLSSA